jgi:hypothetical protein
VIKINEVGETMQLETSLIEIRKRLKPHGKLRQTFELLKVSWCWLQREKVDEEIERKF